MSNAAFFQVFVPFSIIFLFLLFLDKKNECALLGMAWS